MSSTSVVTQKGGRENRAYIIAHRNETRYLGGYIKALLHRCDGSSEIGKGHGQKATSYPVHNHEHMSSRKSKDLDGITRNSKESTE